MEIRRNDPGALPAFARLNLAWIEALHFVETVDQEMADHPEVYVAGRNSVFSVHEEEHVVGVCALKEDAEGEFELTKMAVDPAFQGRGIAKSLMVVVEEYARDVLGRERIYLLSSTKNAAAIRLYRREGWTVTFEGPHPMYERCNIGMEKRLV